MIGAFAGGYGSVSGYAKITNFRKADDLLVSKRSWLITGVGVSGYLF